MWVNACPPNDASELVYFKQAVFFQRLPNTICDHSRVVIDRERDRAFEAVRSGDEQPEPALERVCANPCFVTRADVFAAGDDGRLDAFSAMPRDTFNVENGDRHTASL